MPHDVIDILRCPNSHQPLHRLSSAEIDAANQSLVDGRLRRCEGSAILSPLSAAAASSDGRFIYSCRDDIWELLPGSAIVATGTAAAGADSNETLHPACTTVADDVRAFYDDIGWSKDGSDTFTDASRFEDLRSVSRNYIHRCHMRVKRFLPERGRYLLDCASGPIQYPEYETYSAGFDKRICVDLSRRALLEAQRKLGERGLYIQGDICSLPLADGTVDAAVSLHTIYHVAADRQADAFNEIHRVLSPGATAAVVYSWGAHSLVVKTVDFLPRLARFCVRHVTRILGRAARKLRAEGEAPGPRDDTPQLYFHPRSYGWFVGHNWNFDYEIVAWRSVDVVFLRAFIHPFLGGRLALTGLARLEEIAPHLMGRWGAYPLIVIRKSPAGSGDQSVRRERIQNRELVARAA